MFQSFEVKSDPASGPERLARLREEMRKQGVTTFLVPHADRHQNEYCPEMAERLAWLTGFTGSAGFCIVTLTKAIVFVDGRYTLQAAQQTDPSAFAIESLVETPPTKWLKENAINRDIIAFDPWLATVNQVRELRKIAKSTGAELIQTANLIDQIWDDQPAPPNGQISLHPTQYAGVDAATKISEIQNQIVTAGADMCVLTDPASVCWLLNIRGCDVVHNPLVMGFCIVRTDEKPILFVATEKFDEDTRSALGTLVEIQPEEDLIDQLGKISEGRRILLDPNQAAGIIDQAVRDAGGTAVEGRDPVVLPRAIKNSVEIEGARAAHLRDGVAMVKFLCWLDNQPTESLDEISAAKKLEQIRSENAAAGGLELKEISFDTISGFGPNGAIVHYRVNTESNRKFEPNNLYLSDSGGQYADGTTDITRTIAIGNPSPDAAMDFTLVLKGHIALAQARFPAGTRGVDLDILARNALWRNGRDYGHGTGHGIGSYMNVHEGPQNISRRGMEPLKAGMIISNEPGYYVEGKYGIRIENLVLVREAEETGGNIATHSFETLTLAPIDLRLIDKELMNDEEVEWLNRYHANVFEKLSAHLDQNELAWLKNATANL